MRGNPDQIAVQRDLQRFENPSSKTPLGGGRSTLTIKDGKTPNQPPRPRSLKSKGKNLGKGGGTRGVKTGKKFPDRTFAPNVRESLEAPSKGEIPKEFPKRVPRYPVSSGQIQTSKKGEKPFGKPDRQQRKKTGESRRQCFDAGKIKVESKRPSEEKGPGKERGGSNILTMMESDSGQGRELASVFFGVGPGARGRLTGASEEEGSS